ncbi:MAG: hypothetical protein ABH811_01500 [archaeon]
MFKKKNCKRCGRKINLNYDFCPSCGNPLNKSSNENWGMLGKNDFIPLNNELQLPIGFNKIFNSLVKSLGKELNREFSNMNQPSKKNSKEFKKSGVSIKISTIGNNPPKIQIDSFGDGNRKNPKEEIKVKRINLPKGNIKNNSNLPKQEPATNIKRFSDKVIYEIEIPGVKSVEDLSITQLENSIEIKALAKDKIYFKLIPISLPITDYNLSKGKLILELGE